MVREVLITHPETGERLNKKDWASKSGITRGTLDCRIKKYPLNIALQTGKLPLGRSPWSKEEDDYLCCIYKSPNLYKRWNRIAIFRNWEKRSLNALNTRISHLVRSGEIDSRRVLDESSGWLTLKQLRECIGVAEEPAQKWINEGLKVTRYGEGTLARYKIHLADFAAWACSPIGAALIGKAIHGNAIACTWVLVQTGIWLPEVTKNKHLVEAS